MSPDRKPSDALEQHYLRALASAVQAKDFERAFAAAEEAVARGVEHPKLLGLAAQKHLRRGAPEDAYPLLLRAREADRRNADILNDLGLCMMQIGRAREALGVFDAALRQIPGSAKLYFNKALAYEVLGELDHERHALERVADIDPNHVPALNLLALLAVDRDDGDAVRTYAARALSIAPGEVLARIALATVEIGARNFSEARGHIERLLTNPGLGAENRAIAQRLMGDVLDGEGDYPQAFRFYSSATELMKTYYARTYSDQKSEQTRTRLARLFDYFSNAPMTAWQAKSPRKAEGGPREHVFITGFLRSGTTLLGQVLAGHSAVEIMHERDCFGHAVRDFISPVDGLDHLASLDDAALETYRSLYWKNARGFGRNLDRDVFIDKSPLLTPQLPLVARLFPTAKILFVYRDPRDVVLSCFRRRFSMNEEKYQMLLLSDIAGTYAATMSLMRIYREKLSLNIFDARHETLIDDFDSETKCICDFLGLDWEPTLADFGARARASNMDTPNSVQLARGLSHEGVGHWRHYRKELMPIMLPLAPCCAQFGYPEN